MKKVVLTIRHMKLVEKKKFAVIIFDLKYENFIVHVVLLTNFAHVLWSRKS